jgi:hypothetical protein
MSKLNPQKASAYVGPGVLRKGGKITPVPNGPLIKKKGVFKGSTLKNGGPIKKKAQTGMDVPKPKTGEHTGAPIGEYKPQGPPVGKYGGEGAPIGVSRYAKKAQEGFKIGNTTYTITNSTKDTIKGNPKYPGIRTPRTSTGGSKVDKGIADVKKLLKPKAKNGVKPKKAMVGAMMSMFGGKDNPIYKKTTEMRGKLGGAALGMPGMKPIVKNGKMIKRADGSYSKRGLWDNIRANKGSRKKPTKQMLQQEKKIKAKTKK